MNTLGYLQFFDGLAEKRQGFFSVERRSSKLAKIKKNEASYTYHCIFQEKNQTFQGQGHSRKEALISLYKALR